MPESKSFLHVATKSNTTGHVTWLDGKDAMGTPEAVLMVTPRTNHLGRSTDVAFYPHYVSVVYSTNTGMWGISNSDLFPMSVGAAFSVSFQLPPPVTEDSTYFRHTVSNRNSSGDRTVLDHPMINNRPLAMPFVTPSPSKLFPKGYWHSEKNSRLDDRGRWRSLSNDMLSVLTVEASNHPVGVRYDPSSGRWSIVNNDAHPMTPHMEYHINNWGDGYSSWDHQWIDIVGRSDRAWLDLHHGALIEYQFFISNNLSYDLFSGTNITRDERHLTPKANLAPVATWWNSAERRIALVNSNGTPLRRGLGFNVRHY
ncbi:MAG: hypothetical protein JNK72_25815 [Myxococcales bacterium]|nr:hypothetical protein [Myxococcales bacterium]